MSQTLAIHPSRFDTDVLVVGAGPSGLTLAASLAERGVRATVIDRQAEGANTSRAAVVHARTLEVLEPLDVARRLVARGIQARRFTVRDRDRVLMPIGFEDLPTRYPYTLMVSQAVTESVLLERFTELGGNVLRPRALVDVRQDDTGATVTLDDGQQMRARYVVGADGMNSTVRERAGIGFTGGTYAESFVLADVRLSGGVPSDEVILYFSPAGMVVVAPLPDGVNRIVATVDDAPEKLDVAYVQAVLDTRGPKAERAVVREVVWGSRFRVHHRLADVYRLGRVLLAGDAAHVHSPAGGQGMNAGILDAVTLADALKQALAGNDSALDAYGAVRRPIAQQIVALADRLTRMAVVRPGWRVLRNALLSSLSLLPVLRRQLAWRLSGLVYRASQGSQGYAAPRCPSGRPTRTSVRRRVAMPSVCIHVRKAYSESEEIAIMNAVQAALVTAFGVKPEDTNITLMAHRPHRFMCPPDRDDQERYTNITVVSHATRPAEAKRRFYAAVVDNLEAIGIPRNCSLIQLHELPPGDIAIRGGHPMTDFPAMIDATSR